MSSVEGIISEARSWIGTPYRHQASCKGAGCDCLGLIRGVWRAVAGSEPENVPAYTKDWSEPQGDERLWRAARRHLFQKELTDEAAGDVVLFRMKTGSVAKHLGIVTRIGPEAHFIHAYSGHGVVESAFVRAWRRRIVARFEFPKEMI